MFISCCNDPCFCAAGLDTSFSPLSWRFATVASRVRVIMAPLHCSLILRLISSNPKSPSVLSSPSLRSRKRSGAIEPDCDVARRFLFDRWLKPTSIAVKKKVAICPVDLLQSKTKRKIAETFCDKKKKKMRWEPHALVQCDILRIAETPPRKCHTVPTKYSADVQSLQGGNLCCTW